MTEVELLHAALSDAVQARDAALVIGAPITVGAWRAVLARAVAADRRAGLAAAGCRPTEARAA
jgi:hypothetical protein